MPRKGSAYAIDAEWRARVEARLVEMSISRAELARRAKCSRASITELLDKDSKQSTLVPDVHRALEWPPPAPLVLAPDTLEVVAIYEALSDFDRGEMLGRLRAKAISDAEKVEAAMGVQSAPRKKPARK